MKKSQSEESYNDEETERRREAAIKKMLTTPHKPHEPLGKKPSRKKGADDKPKEGR